MNNTITPKFIIRSVLGLACAGASFPLLAQDAGEYEGLESTGLTTKYAVIAGIGHRFESDIDDGGKSSMTSLRASGGAALKMSEKTSFNFLGSYTLNSYDFEDVLDDPWEDIHTVRLTPLIQYRIDEKWAVYGGPSVGFAAEGGAELDDSFTAGGLLGFTYTVNPQLTLGLGLGIFSQIEDDARIFPVPTVRWQFEERWGLHLGYTEVAGNGGLGGELGYDLNENWKVGLGAQFQRRRFRLDDGGPTNGGVGEDRSMSVYAKAVWKPDVKWAIEGIVGVSAAGEYRLEDEDGHKIGDTDYDPSALVGLRGVLTF